MIATIASIIMLAQSGLASYYWQGSRTASGEHFNKNGISCAHRTLPFGSHITVTNLRNGRSVTCRVNDRGPFIKGRVVDLSLGAARVVGMTQAGVVPVSISYDYISNKPSKKKRYKKPEQKKTGSYSEDFHLY